MRTRIRTVCFFVGAIIGICFSICFSLIYGPSPSASVLDQTLGVVILFLVSGGIGLLVVEVLWSVKTESVKTWRWSVKTLSVKMEIFDSLFMPDVRKLKENRDIRGLLKALHYKKYKEYYNEKEFNVRREAAKALGEIGDARAVEPLIQALKGYGWFDDWFLRNNAAKALGKIGDARAVEALLTAFTDNNMFVCSCAIDAFITIVGDNKATESSMIQHWVGALENVLRFPPEPKSERSRGSSDYRTYLIEKVLDHLSNISNINNKKTAEALTKIFDYDIDDDINKNKLTAAFVKIGEPAVEPLIGVLNSKKGHLKRIISAEILGKIGNPRAIHPLIQALHDRDENIDKAAVKALAAIGIPAKDQLLEVLEDDKQRICVSSVVEALCRFGWKPVNTTERVYYLVWVANHSRKERGERLESEILALGRACCAMPDFAGLTTVYWDSLTIRPIYGSHGELCNTL